MGSYIGTNGNDAPPVSNYWPNLFGFAGSDTIIVQHTFNTSPFVVGLYGGADGDTLSASGGTTIAYVDGGDGNDILFGWNFDDGFRDGAGNDSVFGGNGNDTAYVPYSFGINGGYAASGTVANLTLTGGNGTDAYSSIEYFVFSDGLIRTAAQVLASTSLGPDEYPGTTATTGSITVTQPVYGTINTASDQDWYSAGFGAGITYTIVEYRTSTLDPLVRLYNGAGTLLTSNDDSAGNLNSLLTYTAPTSGTYYLSAGAFSTSVGSYMLGIFYDTGQALFNAGNNVVNLTTFGGNWDAGAGNDVVTGSTQADRVLGGDGYDGLYGGAGDDVLLGGLLEDIVAGDAGNDVLEGGAGGDVLSELAAGAASGNDLLYGDDGVDIMYSGDGDDIVNGGFDLANNYGNLGSGNDRYTGSAGSDVVVGGAGIDTIYGGSGDDSLYGEADSDIVYGGSGIDLLSGSGGNDELFGGADNDLLVGDDGTDVLDGGTGIDVLYGGTGNDIVRGGAGTDGLYGGGGFDDFQVGGTGYEFDYVWDFVGGAGASDRLVFQNGHFSTAGTDAFDLQGLLQNYTYAGGNSTIRVYTPSATAGGGAVAYTLTSTVVVVGVNIATLNADDIVINGNF